QSYRQGGLTDVTNAETARRKEQEIYEAANAWMTVLDERGYLKYADDYELEIRLEPSATSRAYSKESVTIPLYAMMDVERADMDGAFFPDYLHEGKRLALEGIVIEEELY